MPVVPHRACAGMTVLQSNSSLDLGLCQVMKGLRTVVGSYQCAAPGHTSSNHDAKDESWPHPYGTLSCFEFRTPSVPAVTLESS